MNSIRVQFMVKSLTEALVSGNNRMQLVKRAQEIDPSASLMSGNMNHFIIKMSEAAMVMMKIEFSDYYNLSIDTP